MFDTIKDVNYLFLAGARIFSRLGAPASPLNRQDGSRIRHITDTDQEENADPRKYCIYWW
jgi:hypothetical protein